MNPYYDDPIKRAVEILSVQDSSLYRDRDMTYWEGNLKDAMVFIGQAPNVATGYLQASEVLLQESKAQVAVQVLEAGRRQVKQNQEEMEAMLRRARQQRDRRTDFMSRVPYEVANQVVAELPFSDRMRCLTVSRRWRALVASFASTWRDVEIDLVRMGETQIELLRYAARQDHMRELLLRGNTDSINRALGILANEHVQSLEMLSIIDSDVRSPKTLDLSALTSIGSRLRVFEMKNCRLAHDALYTILRVCTSLKSLSYMSRCASEPQSEPASPLPDCPLERLYWCPLKESPTRFEIFLPWLPRLQRLVFSQLTSTKLNRVIPNLHIWCPHLQHFCWGLDDPDPASGQTDARQGMTQLSIASPVSDQDGHITTLIGRHANTLERLFYVADGPGVTDLMASVAMGRRLAALPVCHQLRQLALYNLQASTGLSLFIERCTGLESVRLSHAGEVEPHFFDALLELPRLNTLQLVGGTALATADSADEFGVVMAARERCALTFVQLGTGLAAVMLPSLGKIKSLKQVSVSDDAWYAPRLRDGQPRYGRSLDEATLLFMDHVRGLPESRLESLSMHSVELSSAVQRKTRDFMEWRRACIDGTS
ncbi:hypothetical protein BCR43DRAFT_562478 [Syncephalastrum racemosum]|uniref:F-box domain-containing protein n=1 Tax=Syncephalastrum racemosum TaxID=13706 RepID=A0A1X2HJ68_SYNRA|nr:hypothetical protein BCR43DRAFT_562478 [Syncephalastrum racemosum]